MAKRFIDTKIWDKAWFRRLTPKNKLFWIYLLTRCDHAGIWDADWEASEFLIGEWVNYDELPEEIKEKMIYLKGDNQFFIPSFISFQYGQLKENSKPHLSVIKRLLSKNLLKSLETVPGTIKAQDKALYKDKSEREKEFNDFCKELNKEGIFNTSILKEFISYWTESNLDGKKMKFEMQKTFDIKRRLIKWQKNQIKWDDESVKHETKKKLFEANFKKTKTGLYKAYCSKCGKKEMPNDKWQLKEGSNCCRVDYQPILLSEINTIK